MSQDHKENLNLLFYDFNNGSKVTTAQEESNSQAFNNKTDMEAPSSMTNGQIYNIMMNNTGSKFFQRFGDRLPTREVKSRRGRVGLISAAQGSRGVSLGQSKNIDNAIKKTLIDAKQ